MLSTQVDVQVVSAKSTDVEDVGRRGGGAASVRDVRPVAVVRSTRPRPSVSL